MHIPAALYAVPLYNPHNYKRISLRCARDCAGVAVTHKHSRVRAAELLLLARLGVKLQAGFDRPTRLLLTAAG